MDHALELAGPDHVAIGTDIFIDATDGLWWRAVTGRLYPEVSQGMTYETHNIDGFMQHADFPRVTEAMLARGYSVTQRAGDGRPLLDAGDVQTGDELVTRLHRGTIASRVEGVHTEEK